jgi:hypothetical protein
MTHDEVNAPQHYNVNGIEVIDVIETYTPDSPHLANVLKYVCRHSYKGKPLQDLRKAAWYLARAIELLEGEEEEGATFDEYGRSVRYSAPVNIDGETITEGPCCGLTRDEVAERFEAESVVDALYVRTSPSRIAGDDDTAVRIKNKYYSHDPFLIVGYCANCDKELSADCDHLRQQTGYESEVKFCSLSCVEKLREWQGR